MFNFFPFFSFCKIINRLICLYDLLGVQCSWVVRSDVAMHERLNGNFRTIYAQSVGTDFIVLLPSYDPGLRLGPENCWPSYNITGFKYDHTWISNGNERSSIVSLNVPSTVVFSTTNADPSESRSTSSVEFGCRSPSAFSTNSLGFHIVSSLPTSYARETFR